MTTTCPRLRACLNDDATQKVRAVRSGKHGDNLNHEINMTRVHMEKGLIFAEIDWGVDGLEMPVSIDVRKLVARYEISWRQNPKFANGIYCLRKGKTVYARGLVRDSEYYSKDSSDIRISSENREHAVKLCELMLQGKLRPDAEHAEFRQVEGNIGELRRLRGQVPRLEQRLKEKDLTNIELMRRLDELRGQIENFRKAAMAT